MPAFSRAILILIYNLILDFTPTSSSDTRSVSSKPRRKVYKHRRHDAAFHRTRTSARDLRELPGMFSADDHASIVHYQGSKFEVPDLLALTAPMNLVRSDLLAALSFHHAVRACLAFCQV